MTMGIDIRRLSEDAQRRILEKILEDERHKKLNTAKKKGLGIGSAALPVKLVVFGDPRTKKNHQQILGRGKRCPICGKPERQWIGQGAPYEAYRAEFLRQISWSWEPVSRPVNIRCVYYAAVMRRVDLLNLLASTDDLLVEAGVLADDNASIVISHDGSRVRYDKEEPRVEIFIEEATA